MKLVPLVREASISTAPYDGVLKGRKFAEAGQAVFCRNLLAAIGFQFDRGRVGPVDAPVYSLCRQQRCPADHTARRKRHFILHSRGASRGGTRTLRSRFRFLPTVICSSATRPVWECTNARRASGKTISAAAARFGGYVFPKLQDLFPDAVDGLDSGTMYRAVNVVRPGVNRVSADEISYHLHIVLRYELEIALLSGALSVRDLPAAWNERSAELMGAKPFSDREGVLQDVHWSLGTFGYFPCYTLGSIYAAQLEEAYSREQPLQEEIERGEFRHFLEWLRTHVHRVGHRLQAEEIVARATGTGLDTAAFLRHVESKILGR